VYELTRNLPKFAMFEAFKDNNFTEPTGKAIYNFNEKANKVRFIFN
jgi:hypothetical protein